MEPTNLQKAIAVAQKASQEDQAGNYEEAIQSYQHAVKRTSGKDGNQKIRDSCKKYLDRVEELQQYIVNKEEQQCSTEKQEDGTGPEGHQGFQKGSQREGSDRSSPTGIQSGIRQLSDLEVRGQMCQKVVTDTVKNTFRCENLK